MKKEKETGERLRKARAPRGTREQTAFTFRVDNDIRDWLEQKPNKGRYINQLIAADRDAHQG